MGRGVDVVDAKSGSQYPPFPSNAGDSGFGFGESMIKSPLRYPGGKSRAVKIIENHIPRFKEFREPFVGGGSVFFYVRQKFPNGTFWINDLFEDLYLFYKHMQTNPRVILKKVRRYKNKFGDGKELFDRLANTRKFDETDRAAAFFVLNRITFSGTTRSGGYSKQAFEKRFTESSIQRLEKIVPLLRDVKITNGDYAPLLRTDGEEVFIFLDPPYFKAQRSALYGKNGNLHKGFDYERLARALKETKHKWLMTIDNSEYIKALFDFAYIKEWNVTYGMRNTAEKSERLETELLIANYPLASDAKE